MPAARDGLAAKGRLTLALRDADTGFVVARRSADNLIVTSGIAVLAQALNYGLVYAENPSWGSPYAPPVGAMYGAVGLSSSPAVAGQTAMVAEVGRAQVSNSAVSVGVLSYDFFFPTSQGNGALNEVGTLSNAALLVPTLTAALNSGTAYTSLSVAQVVGTIPSGATLTIGYGTSTTQTVTTTAQVAVGATSIPVTSFAANANYTAGAVVGYTPGTLIDRAVLATPVQKTAAQTMTLNLSITLTSG